MIRVVALLKRTVDVELSIFVLFARFNNNAIFLSSQNSLAMESTELSEKRFERAMERLFSGSSAPAARYEEFGYHDF